MSFFEIFNPGLRHQREERDRLKMLVSKPTHGGGAPLGIDLDGGTAKITITPRTPVPTPPVVDPMTDPVTDSAAETPPDSFPVTDSKS
jgi:hypothetical protein